MASAFASGFKMGGDMFDSAERNRLIRERLEMEKAQEARNAEEQGLRISAARRVNEATDALTNAQTLGLQVPGAQQNNEGLQRQSFRQFEIAQQNGEESPQYVAPTGLQQTYRPASGLEMNNLQAALAAARGDIQGMRGLQQDRKVLEFDEGYKKYLEDWNKMDDDAKGALINQLSYDTGVKGFGTWTPGKGKQAGYMTYLPPTGDPIKLSANEARDLYALTNLMSVDPTRARAEMDKVSDKVRAVAAQAFDAQSKGVTVNNQAVRYGNADEKDRLELGIRQQELKVRQGAAAAQASYYDTLKARANRPQASDLREFVDDNGRVTLIDITGLPRGEDGTIPLPAGLRPRTAKPQFNPKEYAETVKLYTEAGFPIEDARMLADKDYGRGPQSNVDERLAAKNDQVGKGRQPIVVRPGEVIARDPSVPIRGPVDSFVREAVRQPMWRGGGLNYVYRDPVTNRTYTIDEYNKLLSE